MGRCENQKANREDHKTDYDLHCDLDLKLSRNWLNNCGWGRSCSVGPGRSFDFFAQAPPQSASEYVNGLRNSVAEIGSYPLTYPEL